MTAGGEKLPLDVSNDPATYEWLKRTLGRERLTGFYRRSGRLVRVPRIGESGYTPPASEDDDDGEAKIILSSSAHLRGTIVDNYYTFKTLKNGELRTVLPPRDPCDLAIAQSPTWDSVPLIKFVMHTPYLRADGTVNTTPGYDAVSRVLYLPDPTLRVPPVPDEPTPDDVAVAVRTLEYMLHDFKWEVEGDRANYLAALLTPPLRLLLPPPYPLLIITAPMLGSGKTLLTTVARSIHGGVLRSKMPKDDEEIRKQISTILKETTSPVVAWDNTNSTISSGHLASLLTKADWTDRKLGGMEEISMPNDRFWFANGNNVTVGGDMARRCLWSGVDAGIDRPWERASGEFLEPNLERWVSARRGELIWSVLVLGRLWVLRGGETDDGRSDSYARWGGAMARVLGDVGLGEGFYSPATMRQAEGEDDDDLAAVLEVMERLFGQGEFTSGEAAEKLVTSGWSDEMPEEIKVRGVITSRSVGAYFKRNQRRRAGGRRAEKARDVQGGARWVIIRSK